MEATFKMEATFNPLRAVLWTVVIIFIALAVLGFLITLLSYPEMSSTEGIYSTECIYNSPLTVTECIWGGTPLLLFPATILYLLLLYDFKQSQKKVKENE